MQGGLCCIFRAIYGYRSVTLSPYSISSGALESRDLLVIVALHITIILIITPKSF